MQTGRKLKAHSSTLRCSAVAQWIPPSLLEHALAIRTNYFPETDRSVTASICSPRFPAVDADSSREKESAIA